MARGASFALARVELRHYVRISTMTADFALDPTLGRHGRVEMMPHIFARGTPRSLGRRLCAAALLVAISSSCSRNKTDTEELFPRADPIPVHVQNENFLDMNVFVVSSGVSRRLGLVTGNSAGDFKIPWSFINGQSISLTGTPIGGRGNALSGSLNVSPGQMIDFKIGSVLRQSSATVRQP